VPGVGRPPVLEQLRPEHIKQFTSIVARSPSFAVTRAVRGRSLPCRRDYRLTDSAGFGGGILARSRDGCYHLSPCVRKSR
jgi:hypothetical protein